MEKFTANRSTKKQTSITIHNVITCYTTGTSVYMQLETAKLLSEDEVIKIVREIIKGFDSEQEEETKLAMKHIKENQ